MKVLNSNSTSQNSSSNNEGFDYLADKIQYLLKFVR